MKDGTKEPCLNMLSVNKNSTAAIVHGKRVDCALSIRFDGEIVSYAGDFCLVAQTNLCTNQNERILRQVSASHLQAKFCSQPFHS